MDTVFSESISPDALNGKVTKKLAAILHKTGCKQPCKSHKIETRTYDSVG